MPVFDHATATTATPAGRKRELIASAAGLDLALFSQGDPSKPTVVLVHGFPDDHRVWDGVAARLSEDHHVVTYDVRGAGESAKPHRIADYRLDALAADLQAVIDHVDDGGGVHLVGHDWGSVQGWHLVTDPAHRGVLSFTSISGPCIDHVPGWVRRRIRDRRWRDIVALWKSPIYMGVLQMPVLAPLLCRLGLVDFSVAAAVRIFERPDNPGPSAAGRSARANGAAVRMYTANLLPRLARAERGGTDVPVQILTPTADVFIPPVSQTDPPPGVRTVHIAPVAGGHWAPAHNPGGIASAVAAWIARWQPRGAERRQR